MALHRQVPAPNGRPLQHPPSHSTSPPAPGRRVNDALQVIREEYNRVLTERDTLRDELTHIQQLASDQDVELSMIRRAIWNLQNQLEHYRQRFEEERHKLFEELRQQRAAAGLSPPSPLRELSNPVRSTTFNSVPAIQIRDQIAQREATRDRKMKGRVREYPDDECRDPKRARSGDVHRGR
ncbi:hypothetical protein P691DRAFT_69608 [Macrolepiota fuliginosa MF-IS2]|uniref:Transcriptional repressor Tup1 N-terminal domain-containing protein n=1 Tax=Macrolepiota fuliginosa MF-IS2 TaxID=1400762 RepID=A0A9P5XE32_9AGAR|nr:hypothetical protein P691DRAFT_69608 [Macrolepiota fuliginosa MF-IS2]